jgi:transposase
MGSAPADQPRRRTVPAAHALTELPHEIAKAKQRLGLPADARVVCCYEAGRDAFWVERAVTALGVEVLVVEASSIEVPRKARRAKSDGLDAAKLLEMLLRHLRGDRKVWSLVRVPTVAQEDQRHLHRALGTLKEERTRVVNRMQGLLASQGVHRPIKGQDFLAQLAALRLWDHRPLPEGLHGRLRRDWALLQVIDAQIDELEAERTAQLASPAPPPVVAQAQQLRKLKAIGDTSAWLFAMEGLGWRDFRNGREVGGFLGLVPTPHQSGTVARELGISKSGNVRMRAMANEIAWCWVRYQPDSELTQWFLRRFGHGGPRARRIGIVALTRKLVIALWRYVTSGVIPAGAVFKPVSA